MQGSGLAEGEGSLPNQLQAPAMAVALRRRAAGWADGLRTGAWTRTARRYPTNFSRLIRKRSVAPGAPSRSGRRGGFRLRVGDAHRIGWVRTRWHPDRCQCCARHR
jgi:hypothetical protein